MRVLVADDDAVLRFALRGHLEEWSFEVVECADGKAAWDLLQQPSPPLLAIVDWSMPRLDGPALCRELREVPRARRHVHHPADGEHLEARRRRRPRERRRRLHHEAV